MSEHHKSQRWTTFVTWRRRELEQQLPQPCIRCGKPVHADPATHVGRSSWHVGHIIDAAKGGRPTRANTGAEHARCNLSAGGRAGAAKTNGTRQSERGMRRW